MPQYRAAEYWPDGLPGMTIVRTVEQVERMERQLAGVRRLVFDLETSGIAWYRHAQAVGAAFAAWDREGRIQCWYLPFRHQTGEPQVSVDVATSSVRYLLSRAGTIVSHNIKFDEHFSHKEGWRIGADRYDTMIAGALFNENVPLKLETRVERHCNVVNSLEWNAQVQIEIGQLAKQVGMKKTPYLERYGYAQVPINLLGIYACHDVLYTAMLWDFFEGQHSVSDTYPRIWPTEMQLTSVLGEMERNGLPIDVPYLESLRDALKVARAGFGDQIAGVLGTGFRPGSDDEVRDLIYGVYKLPVIKWTKGNKKAVDGDVLSFYESRIPILKVLQQWRDADKLLNTYTESIVKRTGDDHVCHTDFQQVGTNTGRMSSKTPNFQNMPTDSKERANKHGGMDPWSIRRAFVVRKDGVRIIPRLFFDYSQVELRMLAYFTADPIMHDVFLNDGDIHARTQQEVGAVLGREVERRKAKVVNFGLCIAEGQLVLTDQGLVPIESVACWHKVWDGVSWVTHDGVICRGEHEVVTYDGVTATPDHEVYTEIGEREAIGILASCVDSPRLAIGAVGEIPVRYIAYDRRCANAIDWEPRAQSESCAGCMSRLQESEMGFGLQCEGGADQGLLLSAGEVSRSAGENVGFALRRYGATLLSRYACFIASVQRPWDQGSFQFERAFCPVGVGNVPDLGIQGVGFRPDRQRWPLFAGQFEVDHTISESQELDRCQTRRVALVYDILNAGPRRRFTVNGKIVSNSYCLTAMGLARQAKMNMDDAEAFLQAFEHRYAGIPLFRERFWAEIRGRPGHWFANLWGRRRRLPLISSYKGSERRRAERQAIGTLIQGQAAELTKESLVRVDRFIKERGLPVKLCNVVHDDIQMDCPAEHLVEVCAGVKAEMERYPEFYPIPIKVDGDYSTTHWAQKVSLPLAA